MPKLLRAHFCGFGHANARLHPLTLSFRGSDGQPTDSAVLLRNGGGKTSVLSLAYSILLPNKRDFLGKVNNTNRALSEYFLGKNKLGVAILEICTEGDTSHTFALMRASILRERDEDESVFFYFRSGNGGIPLESIPVVGLANPPVPTMKALKEWMWAEHHKRPAAVELIEETVFSQWTKRLAEHGVDPQLFRTHLQMNRAEGAADEVFSFNTSAKFLEFFFGMVIDPPRTDDNESDPIVRNIDEMRRSVQDMPKLQATLRFTERILQPIRDLVSIAEAYEKTRDEAAKIRATAAAFRAGVDAHLRALDAERRDQLSLVTEWDKKVTELTNDVIRIGRYVDSYDHWARKLRYEECLAKVNEAQKLLNVAHAHYRLCQAATEWQAVEEIKLRIAELQAQIERLRQEHRPELLEVSKAAWACYNTYEIKIGEVDEQHRKAGEAAALARTALEEATEKLNTAERAQVRSQEIFNGLARLITAAEQERRRLREEEQILDAHETPEDAKLRWHEKQLAHEQQAEDLKSDTKEAQRRRGEIDGQLTKFRGDISSLEKRQAADQRELDRFDENRKRCEGDSRIKLILGDAPLNPHNPAVVDQLLADAKAADGEKEKLVVLNAENVRTLALHDPSDQQSLLPAPVEIESLVVRLISEGCRTALPGYRWLSRAFAGPQRLSILEKFPEVAAGVVVQTPDDLAKAREILAGALSRPVFVAYTGALTAVATPSRGFHAVLPEENGYFDPQAARLARPNIESTVHTNKDTILDRERERDACKAAALSVTTLANEFPVERVGSLRENVDSFQGQINTKVGDVAKLTSERETIDQRIENNAIRHDEETRQARQADSAVRELQRFIRDHWEKYPENVAKKDAESRAINSRKLDIDQLQQDAETAKKNTSEFSKQADELGRESLRLSTERKVTVSQEYLLREQQHTDIADGVSASVTRYQTLKSTYEGKIQRGEIDGQLKEATTQASAAETTFQRKYPAEDLAKVKAFSGRPDLDSETRRAEGVDEERRQELSRAKVELDEATKRRPDPIPHHERLSLPPGSSEPRLSDEAEAAKAQQTEVRATSEGDLARERTTRDKRKEELARTVATISEYKTTAEVLQAVADDAASTEAAETTGNWTIDHKKAVEFRDTLNSAQKAREQNAGKRDRMAASALEILSAAEFTKFEIEAQRKLAEQGIESLKRPSKVWVTQLEDLAAAASNKMDERRRVHDTLLDILDQQAKIAEGRLAEAQTASRMPDSKRLGEWSGRQFLRANLTIERDPKIRRERLAQLVEKWTQLTDDGKPIESTIPSGAKLAYKCFMALYDKDEKGLVRIQILKPEIVLRLDYKPVEHLAKFSGGERVTAAIILYCIAVRVRGASESVNLDCGFLMLDNPLAKANHSKLINMQRLMAEELGVQLIYYTGINDREALNEFPHHIRLRNNRLDLRSGNMFLEAEGGNLPILQSAILGITVKAAEENTTKQHGAG